MEDPLVGEEGPEAVVETVEERFVPHIEPPLQPLSYVEVSTRPAPLAARLPTLLSGRSCCEPELVCSPRVPLPPCDVAVRLVQRP
jgi:hypothetical protein